MPPKGQRKEKTRPDTIAVIVNIPKDLIEEVDANIKTGDLASRSQACSLGLKLLKKRGMSIIGPGRVVVRPGRNPRNKVRSGESTSKPANLSSRTLSNVDASVDPVPSGGVYANQPL